MLHRFVIPLFHAAYLSHPRPDMKSSRQIIKAVGFAYRIHFHTSVIAVARPSGQSQ